MKKKIKDLTLIEANKYCYSRPCENCPFQDSRDDVCLLDYIAGFRLEKLFGKLLDMEVEINESDNENN